METKTKKTRRMKSAGSTKVAVLVAFLAVFFYMGLCAASPEIITYKSALVWRGDAQGDYVLDKARLSSPGTYEMSPAHTAEGQIKTITANWEFEGEVRLEVSADNGLHYTPIVNGVPLDLVHRGNQLRWRVTIGVDSELIELALAYTDNSAVVGTFGQPGLSGFEFRKPIYITGSSDDELFNYQLKVRVAESAGAASYDAHCGGNIERDFADVRFSAQDGETLLPYYLQEIHGTYPNRLATFWVKVPQIPPAGVGVYIYYGNPAAEDKSCGEEVFDFFDDFAGEELDSEKWEVQTGFAGSCELSNSRLKLDAAEITSLVYQIKDGIIEYEAEAEAGFENWLIIRTEEAGLTQVAYSSAHEGAEHCVAVDDIVKANDAKPISAGTKYIYRVMAQGTELTFERYDQGLNEKQATVSFDDTGGLSAGYVGLKTGAGNISHYNWLRVRRYAAVEPALSSAGEEEPVNLALFSGATLAENGNLILAEGQIEGVYTSAIIPSAYQIRIMVPFFVIASSDSEEAVSIDISADGGATYKTDCRGGLYYYVSKKDFPVGKRLRYRVGLSRIVEEEDSPQLESLTLEYNPGDILLISPNGAEKWPAGAENEITWTASQYESTYPMEIEYSQDNGKTYKKIAKTTENDGSFLWSVPEKLLTEEALVKISDGYDDAVGDTSDEVFSIGPYRLEPEEVVEELGAEEEIDLAEFLEEVGKDPYAQPYELLIKINDSYNPDPEKNALSYKAGDIVLVKPAGFEWTENEKNSFLILQADLTAQAAIELVLLRKMDTGRRDEQGKPIKRTIGRRKFRIDMEGFDLRQKPQDKDQPPVRRFLKKKVLLPKVLRSREQLTGE